MRQAAIAALITLVVLSPAGAAEQGHHANSVSAFLGVTGKGRRQRAGTIGLEYERRLGEHWAIAPAIEHAFGELNFTVVTLSVGYRFDNWAVFAGPGIEWAEHEHGDRSATESEFLFRTGIMYEFEVGELIVAPQAIVDFVANEKVVVFGVTLGVGF
jgi:hypothetical protein